MSADVITHACGALVMVTLGARPCDSDTRRHAIVIHVLGRDLGQVGFPGPCAVIMNLPTRSSAARCPRASRVSWRSQPTLLTRPLPHRPRQPLLVERDAGGRTGGWFPNLPAPL